MRSRPSFTLLATLLPLVLAVGCVGPAGVSKNDAPEVALLAAVRATYCAAPRTADGRVDIPRLLDELASLHANTYSFCIHPKPTDWEDLQRFLPAARQRGIRVWASILPPSESVPRGSMRSDPFLLDYERWVDEFAALSLQEPNLVAWSIDDFTHNLKEFTPERLQALLVRARAINPKLGFVPCCYFRGVTTEFAARYGPLLDGILFPYRHDSGTANLTDATAVESEVKTLRERLGTRVPIILDVYATRHSRLGDSTADYVAQVVASGLRCADGVMIYCHQDPVRNADKFTAVQRAFAGASAEHPR